MNKHEIETPVIDNKETDLSLINKQEIETSKNRLDNEISFENSQEKDLTSSDKNQLEISSIKTEDNEIKSSIKEEKIRQNLGQNDSDNLQKIVFEDGPIFEFRHLIRVMIWYPM